jgi:transposase InsO family protein
MKELAEQKPAWGYRMLHGALRLRGFVVHHKRVHRLYREEKLALRKKSKKHIKCEKRGMVEEAARPGQRWTMDFVHDALACGRGFRILNLTDTFTRHCLGQEVDSSLGAARAVRLLDRAVRENGCPVEIQVDNGPEFRSRALDQWAFKNKVKLVFIEPGKFSSNQGNRPRTVTSKVSMAGSERSAWIRNGLIHCRRLAPPSRPGGSATIANDHIPVSVIYHRISGHKTIIMNRRI